MKIGRFIFCLSIVERYTVLMHVAYKCKTENPEFEQLHVCKNEQLHVCKNNRIVDTYKWLWNN